MRHRWRFTYVCIYVQLLQCYLLKDCSSSTELLLQLCQHSKGLFPGFPFHFIYVSTLPPTPQSLHYCSFILSLQIGWTVSPALFLSKTILAILVPLPFHINFRIILPRLTINLADILIAIVLNLYINLGTTGIFSLSLPILQHNFSPLFWSLLAFNSIVWFSAYNPIHVWLDST